MQLAVQLRRAPPHAENARQQPLRLEAAAHAILHHLPDAQQPRADFRVAVPGALARQHQLVDLESLLAPELEQPRAGIELVGRRARAGSRRTVGRRPARRSRRRRCSTPRARAPASAASCAVKRMPFEWPGST